MGAAKVCTTQCFVNPCLKPCFGRQPGHKIGIKLLSQIAALSSSMAETLCVDVLQIRLDNFTARSATMTRAPLALDLTEQNLLGQGS